MRITSDSRASAQLSLSHFTATRDSVRMFGARRIASAVLAAGARN
jgi:hypothetical protein